MTYRGTAYGDEFGAGLMWPAPGPDAAPDADARAGAGHGTERLVGTGAGWDWRPGPGRPDNGLVFVPTTVLYDAGPLMRSSGVLGPLVPQPHVVMSPFDAGPLGLVDGARVRVQSERRSLVAELRIRDGLTPGVVLAPERLAWDVPPRALLGDRPWVRVTVEQEEA